MKRCAIERRGRGSPEAAARSDWQDAIRSFIAHWQGVGFLLTSGLRILGILIGAWVLIALAQRAIRGLCIGIASRLNDREAVKRAITLGRVFRFLAAVAISVMAAMLVLSELGVSVAPILGAAGVVGLAVGFGAQSLVKDYFTGFIMLLENQIRPGDVVKLGDHAGQVEEVTLRYVQLRDCVGHVHYVPNGTITTVVNMARGHAPAVVDVDVTYDTQLDTAMSLMREVAVELRRDPVHAARILDHLEMAGVERWDESAVVLRARLRVAPLEQWTVRRDYLRRLKNASCRTGIETPFPQMTLHVAAPSAATVAGAAGR